MRNLCLYFKSVEAFYKFLDMSATCKIAYTIFLLGYSLYGMASFALILGFVHEEEFALLALAVGGINPIFLTLSYALSVLVSLIGVTLLAVVAYEKIQGGMERNAKYLPKISGIILVLM